MAGPAAAAKAAKAGKAAKGSQAAKKRPGSSTAGRAEVSGPPTAADNRALRTEMGARDAAWQAAFEMGREGDPLGPEADDNDRAAWDAGAAEARAERRSQRLEAARSLPGLRSSSGALNDGAGLVLGMVLYALALNYLQGGAAQARGWLAAKFLNRPYEPVGKARGSR